MVLTDGPGALPSFSCDGKLHRISWSVCVVGGLPGIWNVCLVLNKMRGIRKFNEKL